MRLTDAISTAIRFGLTGLVVKALDGADWMTTYDHSVDALGSVHAVLEQTAIAHTAGLYFFCWTNPRHDVDMTAEVSLTASIANACDGVFLDVEPYRQFWGGYAPVGLATAFMESVRELAPTAFIALQPDPRPNALEQIRIDEWLQFVDALAGQHYWTDFGTDSTDELQSGIALGRQVDKPILPTLPGDATGASVPVDMLTELPGFVVWRMGTADTDLLEALASVEVAGLASTSLRTLG
jgi:hypothetical protein